MKGHETLASRGSEVRAPVRNLINPAKLMLSKWTAAAPADDEKHFLVTRVVRDARGRVERCVIEAIHSGRLEEIEWRRLTRREDWLPGWR